MPSGLSQSHQEIAGQFQWELLQLICLGSGGQHVQRPPPRGMGQPVGTKGASEPPHMYYVRSTVGRSMKRGSGRGGLMERTWNELGGGIQTGKWELGIGKWEGGGRGGANRRKAVSLLCNARRLWLVCAHGNKKGELY